MYGSYMFPFPYVVSLNEASQVFEVLKEEATVSSVCRKKNKLWFLKFPNMKLFHNIIYKNTSCQWTIVTFTLLISNTEIRI